MGLYMLEKIDIQDIKDIAFEAGQAILSLYDGASDVKYKIDGSPITKADKIANEIICSRLKALYPTIPILSEENKEIAYNERKTWEYLWCIDPMDGTKEFLRRNGEFTVNIALIYKETPVLGVVYAPALVAMYWAKQGCGAYRDGNKRLPMYRKNDRYKIATSKSHLSDETKHFMDLLEPNKQKVIISMGSSAKMCCVADGSIDIYPRLGNTMEWDTAAADIIVREAGGSIMKWKSDQPLKYNKEKLTNPWFICRGLNA
jgi:3'(2'), 5'-bisphosphate nucleotidase